MPRLGAILAMSFVTLRCQALSRFATTVIALRPGTISCKSSIHLPANSPENPIERPVTFPPGCDRFATNPVATGLVANLSQPGGNVTGLSMGFSGELAGKWIELLQEIVPGLRAITVVANLDNAWHRSVTNDIARMAPKRGIQQKVI